MKTTQNKKYDRITTLLVSILICLFGCTSTPQGDGSLRQIQNGNTPLTICDISKVSKRKVIQLSDWMEDFQIVRFENKEEAYFGRALTFVTEHYIGVNVQGEVFKLFDRSGRYICNMGAQGQGPGEIFGGLLYDFYMDEPNDRIYLLPFAHSQKIPVYNFKGMLVQELDLHQFINKPKMRMEPDGSILLTHLTFDIDENPFSVLRMSATTGEILQLCKPADHLIKTKGMDGRFQGFNDEIFSYRNTSSFVFQNTSMDTLYCYDAVANHLDPAFIIDFPVKEDPDRFTTYNEIPGYYLANIWRRDKLAMLIVDQQQQISNFLEIRNDFMGGLKVEGISHFNDGKYLALFEPSELMEHIEERLAEPDCTDADKAVLNKLLASLDENDNNILFMAKLKQLSK